MSTLSEAVTICVGSRLEQNYPQTSHAVEEIQATQVSDEAITRDAGTLAAALELAMKLAMPFMLAGIVDKHIAGKTTYPFFFGLIALTPLWL